MAMIYGGIDSSGLSKGSEAGSVVGAILGATAIFFGYRSLQRRRQHRQRQSKSQREGLLEMHAMANDRNDTLLREPRAEARLSGLPAESKSEELFARHRPKAGLL